MSLTDRDRKLLIAFVPIVVIVAYWFLLLAPKREEAKTAGDQLSQQEERLDAARASAQSAQTAKQDFDTSYAKLVRLGKAIPTNVDMASLLVQLDSAAAGTGIHFTKIVTGERTQSTAPASGTPSSGSGGGDSSSSSSAPPVAAGGQTAQSGPGGAVESANNASKTSDRANAAAQQSGVNPSDTQTSTSSGSGLPVGGGSAGSGTSGTAPSAPAGLETVSLQLEFVGNFFGLEDFFHRVKRFVTLSNDNVSVNGRLITVEGVRWSSDQEIFPKIRAEIEATVYLSPKAQGSTAGATPQGPSTTTPAGGTTPEGGAAPTTPTATATP